MIRAFIADPVGFQPSREQKAVAPGVEIEMGFRVGSKTPEGIAYLFGDRATADTWLREKGIAALRFEEPAPPSVLTGEEMEFEVLSEGTFNAARGGKVTITGEQLRQIADTSNALITAGVLRPPLKLGHGEDQEKAKALFPEGGEPALGWIKRLEVRGQKLVALATGVPSKFVEAITRGAWRTRSAEILPKWTDPKGAVHEFVFRAVAWLGAQAPAVPDLADMVGLADGVIAIEFGGAPASGQSGQGAAHDENPPSGTPASGEPTEEKQMKEAIEMAEKEALQAELDAMKAREKAAREELVTLKLHAAVADRRIIPAQVEAEKAIALAQADPSVYLASVMSRPQLSDDTKALGTTSVPAAQTPAKKGEARLIELAQEIAKEKAVPYAEAVCLAAAAHPDVYTEYYDSAHPIRTGQSREVN